MVETSDGWSIYDIPIVSQRGNTIEGKVVGVVIYMKYRRFKFLNLFNNL